MNYQKNYENKIGESNLNMKSAIAGERINCRLTYKAGIYGVDESGSLKILFRIASDFGEFQFDNSKLDNFVKISSNNQTAIFSIESKSTGSIGKAYMRPWSRGFTLHIKNSFIKKDDEIYVDFINWKIQTFCEKKFKFKIVVDPFAIGKYIELKKSPKIEIIPGQPEKIKIIAPSQVEIDSSFKALIKLEDTNGNPCFNQSGEFLIKKNSAFEKIIEKINFKNGKSLIYLKTKKEGIFQLNAKFKNIIGTSNPIVSLKYAKLNYYWADLHAQSEETVGTNDIDSYFMFAKNYSALDVLSHQANDFQITNEFWKKINKITKLFNKDTEFVTFPGYEWSGNTPLGGDRNILYFDENNPIYRSSHALINNFDYIKDDALTAKDLFLKLRNKKVIVFAHVGGRYADLKFHDENMERAVEIHSNWGTFEWFFHEALKRNYKVGVIANSDGHDGRPGSSYPGSAHFNNVGGLTCILAPNLTRESIFNSLVKRNCYATTGERIYLNVLCRLLDNESIMGDILQVQNATPILKISCCGTSSIDRIEVWNKNKIIHIHYPKIISSNIKFSYSGAKNKGRGRNLEWNGKIEIMNNEFDNKLEKINFFSQDNCLEKTATSIKWQGNTAGGIQALIFNIKKNNQGDLKITINNRKINIPIQKLQQKPKIFKLKNLDAKVEIYKVSSEEDIELINFEYNLKKLNNGNNPIFVKVIQKNGQLAWSSPIYLIKK